MKKHTVRSLKKCKNQKKKILQMLTCYDYQTAQMLSETDLDMILVGDSLGNVVLGYETTVQVTIEEMIIFASAVKRGAKNKFVVADLPFGSYATLETAINNSIKLFQQSQVESLKLEGAFPFQLEIIERLTHIGIPIMGHIGLTPQSVHQQGGYYIHGKTEESAKGLVDAAFALQAAGCFAIVLECVNPEIAQQITSSLIIPTIGIGSGQAVDGEVLVINDLLKMGPNLPPSFCHPRADLFSTRKKLIEDYIDERNRIQ